LPIQGMSTCLIGTINTCLFWMPSKKSEVSVSTRPKQAKAKSSSSSSPTNKKASRCSMRPIRSTIEEYILDHKSQNHSRKTIEWHTLALGNLADFLEKQEITCVEQIERVHILSWLNALGSEPGAKGRMLS